MIIYLNCNNQDTINEPVRLIKAIRELTGEGLYESKMRIDGFRDGTHPIQQITLIYDLNYYKDIFHHKEVFERNGISFTIGLLDRQTYDSLIDAVGKTLMVMTLSENKPIADSILNHIKMFEPKN